MGKCGLGCVVLALVVGACGSRTELYPGGAGDDASQDASVDSGPDATPDAGPDATPDAGLDASIDAEPDVVIDPVPGLEFDCPTSIDDERLPYGFVGSEMLLDGGAFVSGEVASWSWSVVAEKCDAILPSPRYGLINPTSQRVQFHPARPGSYHMVLTATAPSGAGESCEFELPVQGRGLRVELCWDTSTTTDLDLSLHNPFDEAPWYSPNALRPTAQCGLDEVTCNVVNCNPQLRAVCGVETTRVDWGYPDSPLEFCDPFSSEAGFFDLGFCPNPRASTDNNQTQASGTAEVVQLDNPGDGERFRIMVQKIDNTPAAPTIFIYCARVDATFLAPGTPPDFVAPGVGDGRDRFGTMWRPADVEMWVDGSGTTVGCLVEPLSLNGDPAQGPYVTIDDPSY